MGLLSSIFGKSTNETYQVAEIFDGLRQNIINLSDSKEAEANRLKNGETIAILMETGLDDAFYTLVAVNDGTSSLYFSNGGGILGSGEYPQVAKVARELLSESEKYKSHFSITENHPYPKPQFTRFYIIKRGSVLTAEFKENDLGNNKLPVSPLFHKGHELISMIRIASEKKKQGEQVN